MENVLASWGGGTGRGIRKKLQKYVSFLASKLPSIFAMYIEEKKKKKRKRKEASRNTRISIESKYNIFLKFNIGINEFNIDRMSHISQLRTLCMSVPDRWIELERKRWERINKSEGKKSGVPITSLRWTMAESHLITIEFEFSSNRWRTILLIFFSRTTFLGFSFG